uniref:Uncharacterized protein n=1 Tax=Siphoviridae sp. ctvph17 TaxID=2825724 RepID=A0A8S5UJT8_9CAUD|nr:MAG TPA: hypothetical protein [Siphoviridae sp. ctvph17]
MVFIQTATGSCWYLHSASTLAEVRQSSPDM